MPKSENSNRCVFVDCETTGMAPERGDRVVEIGAVEYVDGVRSGVCFHSYLNPDVAIDPGAFEVHGLTRDFLEDWPRFEEIAAAFLRFVHGADVVIHNAPSDLTFLNHEIAALGGGRNRIEDVVASITDSLVRARQLFPGERCSLSALCRRFGVLIPPNTRQGCALIDAELLGKVWYRMARDHVLPDFPSHCA